jgi:hypothetical protein
MVLEDTLVKLMKDVGRKASEDIGMREIGPEWIKNGSHSFLVESIDPAAASLMLKDDFGVFLFSHQRLN